MDLTGLGPGPHLINGITLDGAGNAYATDSLSPVIYKIDEAEHASVLLHDDRFLGEGINLNGIVFHPDGYLLVAEKSDGALFKIPLTDPTRVSRVAIEQTFEGGDGLLLVGERKLVIIANQTAKKKSNAAITIESGDDWTSATRRRAASRRRVPDHCRAGPRHTVRAVQQAQRAHQGRAGAAGVAAYAGHHSGARDGRLRWDCVRRGLEAG